MELSQFSQESKAKRLMRVFLPFFLEKCAVLIGVFRSYKDLLNDGSIRDMIVHDIGLGPIEH